VSSDPAATAFLSHPHRRYNPLCGEWLLVSAERTSRPWLGDEEAPPPGDLPTYDPSCYLCPGNVRANGERNPKYDSTFVFTNDFAALQPDSPAGSFENGLLRAESERGTCLVICFSARHDLSMSRMNAAQARSVVDLWSTQSAALGKRFEWVQVFENRGSAMGASNPHPHGQIWAATPGRARRRRRMRLNAATSRPPDTDSCSTTPSRSRRGRGISKRRRLAGRRSVLGRLALRDIDHPPKARFPASGPERSPAQFAGRSAGPIAARLRRPVRRAVPVFHGLAPGAVRRRRKTALAAPRPLLSAASPGDGSEVHGGLRASFRAAARHNRGRRRGATAVGDRRRKSHGRPSGRLRSTPAQTTTKKEKGPMAGLTPGHCC